MSVGSMRSKLELQSSTASSDGGGSSSLTWSKVATVYGRINPSRANESLFGDQLREVLTHVIIIRHRYNISTKNRLVQTFIRNGTEVTRTFNVKGILNEDNKFKYIHLACEEGVAT
jgi:SPP1 family predicted phage head-tail adaptor